MDLYILLHGSVTRRGETAKGVAVIVEICPQDSHWLPMSEDVETPDEIGSEVRVGVANGEDRGSRFISYIVD
jgi:hypothetical protein